MQPIILTDQNVETTLSPNFLACWRLWRMLPTTHGLPAYREYQLERIPPILLPWSVVVDVMDDANDYQFRFWGTERGKLIGAEMTGKRLSELTDTDMRDGNRIEYDAVCAHRLPLLCDTPIVTSIGQKLSMASIRLPFGGTSDHVEHVFSAIDPTNVTKEHYDHYGTHPRPGI